MVFALLILSSAWASKAVETWKVNTQVIYQFHSMELSTGLDKKGQTVKTILDYDKGQNRYLIHEVKTFFDSDEKKEWEYWSYYDSPSTLDQDLQSCENTGGSLENLEMSWGKTPACLKITTNCNGFPCELKLWRANIPFAVAKWDTVVYEGSQTFVVKGEVVEIKSP